MPSTLRRIPDHAIGELARELRDLGWTPEVRACGHLAWRKPGRRPVWSSATPRCRLAVAKIRADVRRAERAAAGGNP